MWPRLDGFHSISEELCRLSLSEVEYVERRAG